jgi:hypothetical protein
MLSWVGGLDRRNRHVPDLRAEVRSMTSLGNYRRAAIAQRLIVRIEQAGQAEREVFVDRRG